MMMKPIWQEIVVNKARIVSNDTVQLHLGRGLSFLGEDKNVSRVGFQPQRAC